MNSGFGRCFVSYKRERATDVERIHKALRDHGVPSWQDIRDLPHTPLEPELRKVLADPETSSAILYITPEVKNSDVVRLVEAPAIVKRAASDPGFFVVPVAAGGMSYDEAAAVFDGTPLGGHDLRNWNIFVADSDPLSVDEAGAIARRVLNERLKRIAASLPADAPLAIRIFDRNPRAHDPAHALTVDWSHHLVASRRMADGAMETAILPALKTVAKAIEATRGLADRVIDLGGNPSLPTAVAVGVEFLTVRRLRVRWNQYHAGSYQLWEAHGPAEDSNLTVASPITGTVGARDLAVTVSINRDTLNDFDRVRPDLPPLRAIVHAGIAEEVRRQQDFVLTPPQARHAVKKVIEAIDSARATYDANGTVHLFLACPAGFAVLLGQSLNTVGRVVVYEHESGATPVYRPAVTLEPSNG